MNARQKAKYYKHKYEELANMPLPNVRIENVPVDTLRCLREIPERDILNGTEEIIRFMSRYIYDEVKDYIIWESTFLPSRNIIKIEAKLRVVRMQNG